VSAENHAPASKDAAGDLQAEHQDPSLERLRRILLRDQEAKVEGLQSDLERLDHQINDEGSLIKMIAPVLGEAIRLKIQEARDEMIEALYPIIGQVVGRAVAEAVSDLARSLDAQAKRAFDFRLMWWRLKARFSGATEAQIRLRELLPFSVTDVLLIHRESGLLLYHLLGTGSIASDSDLFSGMLTAIRDFSQDTLGGDEQDELGEITYGEQRILIETTRHSYLAVIVNGNPPPGFRGEMRDRVIEIENAFSEELADYGGNAGAFDSVKEMLQPLITTVEPKKLSKSQKRFMAGAFGFTIILLAGCILLTSWLWRASHPAPPAVIVQPTQTFTTTPTITPSLTPTILPSPTATATVTATLLPTDTLTAIPEPFIGVMLGNVWMRTGPTADSELTGMVLVLGERVELLAVYGDWVRVRQTTSDQYFAEGWIPARWFGSTGVYPIMLITPTVLP